MNNGEITWTCEICGQEMPDTKITVSKYDISATFDLLPGTVIRNVRHCLEEKCASAAKAVLQVFPAPKEVYEMTERTIDENLNLIGARIEAVNDVLNDLSVLTAELFVTTRWKGIDSVKGLDLGDVTREELCFSMGQCLGIAIKMRETLSRVGYAVPCHYASGNDDAET